MQDIFITNIAIHKVRHLENIEIQLSQEERKHLILTGKNGSGKTSILQALREALAPIYIEGIKGDAMMSSYITCQINTAFTDDHFINHHNFVLAFLGAKRSAAMEVPESVKKIDLQKEYKIDIDEPGKIFLQYLVNLKVEKSFAHDDGDSETVSKIDRWFTMFEGTLQELFEDHTLRLEFDRKNFNFTILTKHREPFDFNTLADGFSAAINILADLIIRMANTRIEGYDRQGIVLIDEIETHLHVSLQKKILPFLTNFFPKIQFIVSTHSPFVLSSLSNAVIYDLENRLRVEDLSPYSYEAVVERYFDVDQYSERIKNLLKTYETLLHKDPKAEEEQFHLLALRNYLKKIPADFAPELVAHFQSLQLRKGATS